jgi:hypothetical protein
MSRAHRSARSVAVALILIAMLAPRLPSIGSLGYLQPNWVPRPRQFMAALAEGRFAHTFRAPHPGVTTMWLFGAALELAAAWRGPLSPPERVWVCELVQLLWTTVMMLLVFFALRRLLVLYGESEASSPWVAVVPCLMMILDPMFLTMTQVVSLDGPLSVLVVLVVLWFLIARTTRSLRDFGKAGVLAGLAVLTKSPGLIFVFAVGLWLLIEGIRGRCERGFVDAALRPGCVFGVSLVLTFVLCWPAMWVAPLQTLEGMVLTPRQAKLLHAGKSEQLFANAEEQKGSGPLFDVVMFPHTPGDLKMKRGGIESPWLYYPAVVLFRTPPLTLILLAVALGMVLAGWRRGSPDPGVRLLAQLAVFGLVYFVIMSIAAKKTWRYMEVFLVFAELAGGLALVAVTRLARLRRRAWASTLVALSLAAQYAHVLSYAPHFLFYYNPLAGGRATADRYLLTNYWGEGIGEAARYLRAHARSEPIAFFASSSTTSDRLMMFLPKARAAASLADAEFLVITAQQVTAGSLSPLERHYWRSRPPHHVVVIHRVPCVWIYRIKPA